MSESTTTLVATHRSVRRGGVNWLFRNRRTEAITVAQFPNVPLGVFLVLVVVRWILHPSGTVGTVVGVVAGTALTVWAVDEAVRGVNPWRRMLGATVLALVVVALVD